MRDSINAARKLREKNMAEARKAVDDKVSAVKQRVSEQVKKVTTSLMSVSSEVQGVAGNVTNGLKTVVPFRKMRALEEAAQGALKEPVIDFGQLHEEDQGDDDSPPGTLNPKPETRNPKPSTCANRTKETMIPHLIMQTKCPARPFPWQSSRYHLPPHVRE